MSYTTPLTAAANAALTAAQWNASVRDNLQATAVGLATAAGQHFVSTAANALAARTVGTDANTGAETTNATSYADLTSGTAGPQVTATTGVHAFVIVNATLAHGSSGAEVKASYEISGATTQGADDSRSIRYTRDTNSQRWRGCFVDFPGLTAGSNTFKIVYAVSTGTGTLDDRELIVIPW